MHAILRRLAASELLYLLPSVAGIAHHPSAACRATMYDIFMWIYDNYRSVWINVTAFSWSMFG